MSGPTRPDARSLLTALIWGLTADEAAALFQRIVAAIIDGRAALTQKDRTP